MCVVVVRVGVITDPPLQDSVSDPQTLLDALEEPVAEVPTLTPTDSDASSFVSVCTLLCIRTDVVVHTCHFVFALIFC